MPAAKQRTRKVARPKAGQPGAKYPSPLAYPGGKARVLPILLRHIPAGLTEMVSPFIGGGALELTLARQGVRVRAYDAWEHLVCFWKELKRDREGLAARVRAYGPPADREVVRELRREMLRKRDRSLSAQDRAARFFVSSRCSFRGIMTTGGLGGDFTERSIEKLRDTRVPRKLSVACLPFERSLGRHPELLAFCDPPYVEHGALRGVAQGLRPRGARGATAQSPRTVGADVRRSPDDLGAVPAAESPDHAHRLQRRHPRAEGRQARVDHREREAVSPEA